MQIDFRVMENKMLINRAEFSLCGKMPAPDLVKSNLVSWGVPFRCPVNESSTFCYKGNKLFTLTSISQKMLSLFAMPKQTSVRILITHDTGISCFEADCSVIKKN